MDGISFNQLNPSNQSSFVDSSFHETPTQIQIPQEILPKDQYDTADYLSQAKFNQRENKMPQFPIGLTNSRKVDYFKEWKRNRLNAGREKIKLAQKKAAEELLLAQQNVLGELQLPTLPETQFTSTKSKQIKKKSFLSSMKSTHS